MIWEIQGLRLTFLLTTPVASDNFDFTSQNQFSTSQNFQVWSCIFCGPRGDLRKGRHFNLKIIQVNIDREKCRKLVANDV